MKNHLGPNKEQNKLKNSSGSKGPKGDYFIATKTIVMLEIAITTSVKKVSIIYLGLVFMKTKAYQKIKGLKSSSIKFQDYKSHWILN